MESAKISQPGVNMAQNLDTQQNSLAFQVNNL